MAVSTHESEESRGEDHALLDFAAGGMAGEEAADTDAETERGEEVAAVLIVDAENVSGVEDDVEKQERAEEPEEGVGEDGHPKRGLAPNAARIFEKFAREVPVEAAAGIGGGEARHQEREQHAGQRQCDKNSAGPRLAAAEMLGEESAGERGEDGGEKSGELDDAVAPAEFGFGEEFGQERVFCWAKDRTLGAGQEEGEAGKADAIVGERERSESHDEEFEDFHAEGDAALAVFIGEVATGDREDEERNGEEERNHEDEPKVALIFVGEGFEDEEADEPLQRVVAEGVLKLDGDERPEPA